MKVNLKELLINICFFFILLYPFNSTITNLIYPNIIVLILSIAIPLLCLFILALKKKINKKSLLVFTITIIASLFVLFNNYYYKDGFELKVIIYLLYLFVPLIIMQNEKYIDNFFKVIKIFLVEHITATFIALIFKGFYQASILPLICKDKVICTALGNFYHGYIPGLTTHFSTNAIYLSIAVLFFFILWMNKRKKSTLFFLVISVIALLVTGKRAHFIFSVICCLFLYLFDNKIKNKNKLIKIVFITLTGVIITLLLSNFIPEILNIITRFISLIDSDNLLNGRSELYNLALTMWEKKPILGTGWGAFSHYYQLNLYTIGELGYLDAHNVYLQLLCETGLIGFLFFTSIIFYVLVKTMKLLKNDKSNSERKINALRFSLLYQMFFALYCLTGNPLYDPQCYVMYFISIGIFLALNKKEVGEE